MKKIALSLILVMSFFVNAIAQQGKMGPESGGECPAGECTDGIRFQVTMFNLHRPRTNCENGFGLCIKLLIGPHCSPCIGTTFKTGVANGEVNGWYNIKGDQLELHLPASIQAAKEFATTDMDYFEIEDKTFLIKKNEFSIYSYVKGGRYPVRKVKDELVISFKLTYN